MGSKKIAFFLPNSFTALNMLCGFLAIMFSYQDKIYWACIALMLGCVFDSVDGRLARLTGTQSLFGEQFDSMSDMITFGAAPAFIVFNHFLSDLGRVGIVVSFFYLLCGALRLARFNANIEKVSSDFFQGLPSPAAALGIVGLVLFSQVYEPLQEWDIVPAIYIFAYSILMISNVPFNSFKNSQFVKEKRKLTLIIIFILFSSIITYERVMIFAIISTYVLSSVVYFLLQKDSLNELRQWPGKGDPDD
jgi:CDP-diacylglycerol--serine O-phosphatidyltransferase